MSALIRSSFKPNALLQSTARRFNSTAASRDSVHELATTVNRLLLQAESDYAHYGRLGHHAHPYYMYRRYHHRGTFGRTLFWSTVLAGGITWFGMHCASRRFEKQLEAKAAQQPGSAAGDWAMWRQEAHDRAWKQRWDAAQASHPAPTPVDKVV